MRLSGLGADKRLEMGINRSACSSVITKTNTKGRIRNSLNYNSLQLFLSSLIDEKNSKTKGLTNSYFNYVCSSLAPKTH
jgi:hypothetical protein